MPVGGKGGKAGPGGYAGKEGRVRPGYAWVYREEWMRVVGWSTGTSEVSSVELRQGLGLGPHLAIVR